jgi:hypothetical protein
MRMSSVASQTTEDKGVQAPMPTTQRRQRIVLDAPAPMRAPTLALGELLDAIVRESRRFLHMQEWERHMLALWVVYTHAYNCFDHAPLLGLYSPVPGCGKTDAMRFMEPMVQRGTLEVSPTRATLFREIEQHHPTLLLDEMDKAKWGDIRDIINSGFTRGAKVPRCEGDDNVVTHFRPFGPKAIATMGKQLPPDTDDRALMVRLKKKPPAAKLEQLKMALHEERLKGLGAQAAAWVKMNRDAIIACEPKMPPIVRIGVRTAGCHCWRLGSSRGASGWIGRRPPPARMRSARVTATSS